MPKGLWAQCLGAHRLNLEPQGLKGPQALDAQGLKGPMAYRPRGLGA